MLSAEAISQLDSTGAMALDELHGELKARGVQLVIARPKQYMRRYGQALGLGDKIGMENIFFSIRSAVASIQQRDARAADSGQAE